MRVNAIPRSTGSAVALLLMVAVCGCVPYQTYDELSEEYERINKAYRELSARYGASIGGLDGETSGVWAPAAHRSAPNPRVVQRLRDSLDSRENEIRVLRARIAEVEAKPSVSFSRDVTREIPGAEIGRGGQLILGEAVLFNPGSFHLKGQGKTALATLARLLKTDYPDEVFHIVGHTDNAPLRRTRSVHEYNLKLGFERAYTVFKYLNLEHGIPESQIRLHTYGFSKPTDRVRENTPGGRAKNRRVEIYLSGFDF